MKISVTNLGPIRQADIDLAPLTIFIGPNNSGKSALATVVYATLYQAGADRQQPIERQLRRLRRKDKRADEANDFLSIIAEQRVPYDEIPTRVKEFLTELLKETIEDFAALAPYEIQRATGTAQGAIITAGLTGNATAEVRLASQKPRWRASSVMMTSHNVSTTEEPPQDGDGCPPQLVVLLLPGSTYPDLLSARCSLGHPALAKGDRECPYPSGLVVHVRF